MRGTTKERLIDWFERGKRESYGYMIVVCDCFDYEDYPVYCDEENAQEKFEEFNDKSMQKVMEVYDLNMDMMEQMNVARVFNMPRLKLEDE